MKPLLPAPYTPEDEAILFRHGRGRWATTLRASGLQADIRDAELMLRIERRLTTVRRNPGRYATARVVVCVCIDPVFWPPVGAWEVDITYCA